MDHIGSVYRDNPKRQAIEMEKYFSTVKAFKKLSHARSILSEAYASQSSKAHVRQLEESAESLPYWVKTQ